MRQRAFASTESYNPEQIQTKPGNCVKQIQREPQERKLEAGMMKFPWFVAVLVFAQAGDCGQAAPGRPKIGVALQGGGAKGLAHIGVLRWFEERHIPVHYIAGTSMGGLIGGLYAIGHGPSEMQKIVEEIKWGEVLSGETRYPNLAFRRKED